MARGASAQRCGRGGPGGARGPGAYAVSGPSLSESGAGLARAPAPPPGSLALITGGAGFIGCNLAHRLLSSGVRVRIVDNLSRGSVAENASWLRAQHGSLLELWVADVR